MIFQNEDDILWTDPETGLELDNPICASCHYPLKAHWENQGFDENAHWEIEGYVKCEHPDEEDYNLD